MSSPPYFYASRPSSRQNSRPTSPLTNAELRTQAVAKLKRAASLPRSTSGKRPQADKEEAGPSDSHVDPNHVSGYGPEEVLGPVINNSINMDRSASSSSSFHATPPLTRPYDTTTISPFFTATSSSSGSATPDWAAMQLAQSYLPSLSPVIGNSSTANGSFLSHPAPGRSTPSPLPSLGELRSLQRSNSAAARAKAMTKLTGGNDISEEVQRPLLQRADSVGAPRMLDQAILRPTNLEPNNTIPRPRLQRSFTVSSSNMGEERRSAVGRRMVERLAQSKAARKQEDEVKRLWEEKVGAKAPESEEEELSDTGAPGVPRLERHSPIEPAYNPSPIDHESFHLPVPARAPSRSTIKSSDEAFEYDSHLRRSLSSRTARQEMADLSPGSDANLGEDDMTNEEDTLAPPIVPFATPSRHVQHDSTSTQGTIQPSQGSTSPASTASRDALQSMMFVMGAGGQPKTHTRGDGSWPLEVEDAGSEWGTPARANEATFQDNPQVQSPTTSEQPIAHTSDDESLHRVLTRPESDMSWEEVGGMADREVPSDPKYYGRKNSVSAKIKRTVGTAMKKRSQSRSSVDSSNSYRGSESPTSPTQYSFRRMSKQEQPSSSAALAQAVDIPIEHSTLSFPPRADPQDPRMHNPKLSPFPGIAHLEEKRRGLEEPPRLIQQSSDSAIPSAQRVQPVIEDSIYSLPLPVDNSRRGSGDSVTKKGWLAKTFKTSPRSSESYSRKSSNPDVSEQMRYKSISPPSASVSTMEDPFAGPSLPMIVNTKARGLSLSPAVSVVQETSEEGSRHTRFTQNRPASHIAETNGNDLGLPQRSMEVLERMDEVLAMSPDDPARPEMLDDPPRKLLLSTQVLQVVNAHTVKDRYLFLFNDILVIAKPLITQGIHASLDMQYIVKSVVSLDKLLLSGITAENSEDAPRHPVVQNFIDKFAEDPVEAVRYLVERSNPKVDPLTLASLLFKTPELDKQQIGMLLAHNTVLLEAFVDRFHFSGIKIDQALRMFLLSLRLPAEINASETLLRGFSNRYFEANKNILECDRETTSDLVLSIMQLDDSLYSTFGKFAFENTGITLQDYVSDFESKHPRLSISRSLLEQIYDAIKRHRLSQSLSTEESGRLAREIVLSPGRLPAKLTYDVWSDPISITIPTADPDFVVRLVGDGMEFSPKILDFAKDRQQTFRVKGKSLGVRSVLFDRLGSNAPLYASLGSARTFTVERSFMQHTFQFTFVSHLGLKRKYCFSVPDDHTRNKWISLVQRQAKDTSRSGNTKGMSRVRLAAEGVALQVLRDALIPTEDKNDPPPRISNGLKSSVQKSSTSGVNGHDAKLATKSLRKGSVSVAYDLSNGESETTERDMNGDGEAGLLRNAQTGKELVLLCRQNSLLPGLLQLLQAGIETGVDARIGGMTTNLERQRAGARF